VGAAEAGPLRFLGPASGSAVELGSAGDAGKALKSDDAFLLGRAPSTEIVKTVSASGEALTVKLSEGTVWSITLTKNTTLTFPAPEAGKGFTLRLAQDGTGGRTVTWPASTRWSGGVYPLLSTAKEAVDLVSFVCIDGEHWLGFFDGKSMAVGGGSETIPTVVQEALNKKAATQGLEGLIVPNGIPMKAATIVGTANKAYYARFVAPFDFTAKSITIVTTEAATTDQPGCAVLFAADGTTILATSGQVKARLNQTPGAQNFAFAASGELKASYALKAGPVYYASFQYGGLEGGTAATLGSVGFTSSKLSAIAGGAAGSILLANTTPTFPFATTPSIANNVVAEVPLMYIKSS
jgi:hypothetical protein